MRSGVPQGTVLGPLCFLFVNDIGNDITSNIKLFADDTLLYGLVHNSNDAISLQSDLDKLVEWAKLWQMGKLGLGRASWRKATRCEEQPQEGKTSVILNQNYD